MHYLGLVVLLANMPTSYEEESPLESVEKSFWLYNYYKLVADGYRSNCMTEFKNVYSPRLLYL